VLPLSKQPAPTGFRQTLDAFKFTRRGIALVWETSRPLTAAMAALTLIAGLVPAGIAVVGRELIDAVLRAADTGSTVDEHAALTWVAVEAGLVVTMAACQRGIDVIQSLLRAQLGHKVNFMILEKALTLELPHFEDSEFYDKMTRARREASSRPLSLVSRAFGLIQNTIALSTYGVLLWTFSPLAFVLLSIASIPAFVAETRFAGEAFRLFSWRSPDARVQFYLETVMAREDYAKEVKLLGLGPELLGRYQTNFERLYAEDRDLTVRRGGWGFVLGLVSTTALYGAYAWIALAAMIRAITLGQMTMYLLVFKQGQAAFGAILKAIGGMYEDNLYLSNLYAFLEQEVDQRDGSATDGPKPNEGVRFHNVSFTYPDATTPALTDVSLHLQPGRKLALVGHNGSGKTTLIKLLARLYRPTSGSITLDGRSIEEWSETALHDRIGVIFQDFVRYQLTVGENVGVGDVARMADEPRLRIAAEKGMALPFVEEMENGFETQLGKWFPGGRELSVGQWQKVALSRAFMRGDADILVLDEPTASMDSEAEAEIFERVRSMADHQMAILISHRFSTVRMADDIVVLDGGKVVEYGDHDSLMKAGGRYAHLFSLQAAGYQ
jgi:ATP-binding cassette subfamily B protein